MRKPVRKPEVLPAGFTFYGSAYKDPDKTCELRGDGYGVYLPVESLDDIIKALIEYRIKHGTT